MISWKIEEKAPMAFEIRETGMWWMDAPAEPNPEPEDTRTDPTDDDEAPPNRFKLFWRRPTWEQAGEIDEIPANRWRDKLVLMVNQSVTGWDGVNRDGQPVPFTVDNLLCVCGAYFDFAVELNRRLNELYFGPPVKPKSKAESDRQGN